MKPLLKWPKKPRKFPSSAGEHLEWRSRCGGYLVRRVQIVGYKRPWYQALQITSPIGRQFVDNARFEQPATAMAACELHARRTRPRQKKLRGMARAGA